MVVFELLWMADSSPATHLCASRKVSYMPCHSIVTGQDTLSIYDGLSTCVRYTFF